MNHVLFLECSPYGLDSSAARQALAVLRDADAEGHRIRVTTRCLAGEALAPLSAQYARAITTSARADDPAFVLSERLIRELESSDGLLISTPLHNFTVPAALKLWIDHVVRRGRTFTVTHHGKVGARRAVRLPAGGLPTHRGLGANPSFTVFVFHSVPFHWRDFMSTLRLPYQTLSPDAYQGLAATKQALDQSTLGKPLIDLVYLRVSQINGCAFCLAMHASALRAAGVPNAKLDSLPGWRVSPHYDERERAALAWTEALVDVARTHAADPDFEPLKAYFSDAEIADLSFAIGLMSAFNRLAIGMRQ